jgi:hypothetical protein
MSEVRFTEEAALAAAVEASGLSNLGSDDFREGLRVLLETYDTTAGLSEKGRHMNFKRVVDLLATRLRVERAFELHPEIRDREIRSPLFLTGLPRTGTSALFNLLGMDPASRPLYLWEGFAPDPVEGLAPGEPDPRYLEMKATYERMRENSPDFTKIHYADADAPEECVLILAATFEHVHNGIEVLMEPYQSWFQQRDLRAAYAWYRDVLKMLDWQRPGERWLLKSPAHLWALDVLVELFPDCCIVLTHRNPLEVVGSYCSMMEMLFRLRDCAPQPELGPTVLEYLARSLERGLEARDRDPDRFIDIRFDDFAADNMGSIGRIYEQFSLPFSAASEATMRAHARDNPRGKHGAHQYELEKFGLSNAGVKDRLATYIDRFDLPTD